MRNSDGLFRLIRSLKNAEKSNFRQFAGMKSADAKYLRLFDIINNADDIDKLSYRTISNELNYLSFNTYYVAKNYLSELILKSLISSQTESSLEDTIRNRISCIRILYEKNLFSKALEILKKVKKLAVDSENYLKLLEILKWEKNLVIEGAIKGEKEEILSRLFSEEEFALKCISNIGKYRLLSFRFSSLVRESQLNNSKGSARMLKNFMAQKLLQNENNALTLVSRITFLDISASVNQMAGNYEKVYFFRKKMISLLDGNRVFRGENLTNYVISLYNFANTCFELGNFPETEECILKMRTSGKENKLTTNTKMLIDIGSLRLEIAKNLELDEFKFASENSLLLAELMKKYDKVLTENEKTESLILSIEGLYLNKEFNSAIELINHVNRFNMENLSPAILVRVKFIQILILFDSGKFETVDHFIISLQRLIQKTESVDKLKVMNFRFIKQVIRIIRGAPSQTELRLQIAEELKKSEKGKASEICGTFLRYWIKARVPS